MEMTQTPTPDYYEILGVAQDATAEEIRAAWRSRTRFAHPDSGGTSGLFRLLQTAYETLSDPAKRASYDASLNGRETTTEASETSEPSSTSTSTSYEDYSDHSSVDNPQPGFIRLLGLRPHHWIIIGSVAMILVADHFASLTVAQSIGRNAIFAIAAVLFWRFIVLLGKREAKSRAALHTREIVDIDKMDGVSFERRLALLFKTLGYKVTTTAVTGDFGADLVITRSGEPKTIVQAKRSARSVGVSAVQEAYTAMSHYQAERAMVVTNNIFTRQAVQLASESGVVLCDRGWLLQNITLAEEPSSNRLSDRSIERAALWHGIKRLIGGLVVFFLLSHADDNKHANHTSR